MYSGCYSHFHVSSFFFTAQRNSNGDYCVDGGILENYPIRLFDRQNYVKQNFIIPDYYKKHNPKPFTEGKETNPYVYNQETLGFRLDSQSEIAIYRDQTELLHYKIDNFFDFTWGLVETVLESQGICI